MTAIATELALFAASGCVEEPGASPTSQTTKPSSPKQSSATAVEIVREMGGNEFGITVLSAQSNGTNLELKVSMRITKPGPTRSELRRIWSSEFLGTVPDRLRLIDFENGEVFETGSAPLEESTREKYSASEFTEPSAEPSEFTAYFANPKSDRVSILMPFLGLIEDVPVVKVEHEFKPEGSIDALSGYKFGAYSVKEVSIPFESESSVALDYETVQISVPSDILFEFGAAELSGQAVAAIESVKTSVMEYSSEGKLTVIGHTDDQGSDAINRPLSLARANMVADVLRGSLPEGKYSTEVEGMGSDQPVMDGQSEKARAANRRVEIQFAYAPPAVKTEPTLVQPPAPEKVAQGHDPIEEYREGNSVRVSKVERIHGYLVASFALTQTTSSDYKLVDTPFNSPIPPGASRYYELWETVRGVGMATMITGNSRVLPIGHRLAPATDKDENAGKWSVLGDRNLQAGMASNTSLTATVIWPDPGTDTITVDIADRWRITDIPVVDSKGE